MDKKISEFKVVTATDNTTQIPLVQGLPLENCKITPRNFSSSVAEILLARPEFDLSTYAKKEDLNKKVDKVTGKGLSTNDYTTTEKNKLSGIASGANNYTHPAGTNPHGTTKADVGLGSANNTSDANKPVSTAQAAAIALKIDASKFQVVAELPTSPTAGVFYFVKE